MKAILRKIKMRLSKRNVLPLPAKAKHSPTTTTFSKICYVPGWFTFDDCVHFSIVLGMQRSLGIKGDILEIGCYHGRSTSLLASFLENGEKLYVCDIFEGGDKDLYGQCPMPELVVSNILKVNPGLKSDFIKVFKGESSKLSLFSNDKFRFVHVDGGHSYNECLSDLRTCIDHVVEGGIIVVDDYMHTDWPEVTAAADNFMKERDDLRVVADINRAHAIGRKLYLMRRNNKGQN